jgi:hypothetical protein
MNNVNLQNLILADCDRIATAISTGAAWEVWMQVELALILRAAGEQVAREVHYPPPNARLVLDVGAQDSAGHYAIELKVESANNSGAGIMAGINEDRYKLLLFPRPNPGARWAVGIGYSLGALHALAQFAGNPANAAIYGNRGSIGVLIATV